MTWGWVDQPWPVGWPNPDQLEGLRGMRWLRRAKSKFWLGCLHRKQLRAIIDTTWFLWVHQCWICSPKKAPLAPLDLRLEV